MNQGIRRIFKRRTRLVDDNGSASSSDDADDHCDSEIKKDAQEEVSALDIDALVHVAVELENLEPVTIVKQSSFSRHRKTRRAMRAELAEELEMARMNSSQEWSVASSDAGQNSEVEINATRIPRSEGTSRRSTSRGRRSSSGDRGELTRASCEDAIRQVRERSSERRPRRGSKDKILACLEKPSADTSGEQDRQIVPSTQTEAGGSDHNEQAASTSPRETSCMEKKKEKKPSSSSRHSNGSLATSRHTVASGKPSLETSMSSRRIETRKDRGSDFKRSSSGHFPRTSLGGSQANDTASGKRGSSGGKQGTSNDRSPTHGDDCPKEPYADRADCSESKPPTTPEISNVSPLHENPARPLENATPATHRARRVGSNQQSSSRRIILRKKASSEDLISNVSRKDSCDVTSNQELTAQKDQAPRQHRDSCSSSNSKWKHHSGSEGQNKRRSASHDDSVPQPLRSSRIEKGKPCATVDADSHSDDDDSDRSLDFHKCFTNGTSSKSVDKAREKQVEKVTPSSFVSRYGDKTADKVSKTSIAPKAANGREKRPVRKICLQLKPLKSEATTPSLVAGEGPLDVHHNRSFRRDNQAARVPGRRKSEEWSSVPPVDSDERERANKAPSFRQSMHSQQAREKGIPRHSTREDVQRVTHFFSWDDDDTDDDDSSVEMVVQAIDYEKNMDRKRLLCKANSATSLVGKGSKYSTENAHSSVRSLRM